MSTPLSIHILTEPFTNQNTRAFLFPILRHRRALEDAGLRLRLFFDIEPGLTDCDVLAINNKRLTPHWQADRSGAVALIADLAEKVDRLVYFDRSSTAGSLEAEVVPLVSAYCKTALFHDRMLYTRPLYCGRLFSQYYHDKYGVTDIDPTPSSVLTDPAMTDRLHLSWNTALADYSLLGPRLSALYGKLPLAFLLSGPWHMTSPADPRPIDVSCRMNLQYPHESIAFQRRRMAEALTQYRRSDRVNKVAYYRELRQSQIVASPFGTSEINYKDYEVFITGGTLLKPDMSHLDTWPQLYDADVTYARHSWDLEDLDAVIEGLLASPERRTAIAEAAQSRYRAYVQGASARDSFVQRFEALLRPST